MNAHRVRVKWGGVEFHGWAVIEDVPMRPKTKPAIGQWWRFEREEGVISRILPGGGGDMGIAVFDGPVPPAHVSTMLRFAAWTHLPNGPTVRALPPPCTCITLDGGIILSDGCAAHDAAGARSDVEIEPRRLGV